MPQPKTFREAAEQKEQIDQQYKFRDIGYRKFVQEMESLDSHIVSLTIGKESLLDAAQDMYDALTALSVVSGEVLALCSSGLTVPRKVWENTISADGKAIAVCKQAKGETA